MSDKILKAGEFVIDECIIHTTTGQEANLLQLPYALNNIAIEEDIEQASIFGSITFIDSTNVASEGPIIGQETLTLKIRTTGINNEDSIIDFSGHSLMIFSIQQNVPVGETLGATQIGFCSFEMMEDRRIRLSQSFEGTYDKIVEKVFRDVLKSKKKLWIEESVGKKKIIAPNVSPFDVIRLAMRQSVNESKEPTYYFWETTKGYSFRTLESMYATSSELGAPMFRYIEKSQPGFLSFISLGTPTPVMDILNDLASIDRWEILSGADTLFNYENGTYASKLIEHDIFNKTYTEYKYDYLEPKIVEQHMPAKEGGGFSNLIYSATPINEKGDTISTLKDRTFLFPVSLKDAETKRDAHHTSVHGESNYIAPVASEWHQRRVSMKQQIRPHAGLGIKIYVHGNTVLNAGDMIIIDLMSRTLDQKKQKRFDNIYSGPFLIKQLKHNFIIDSMSHEMEITAVKDSLPIELPPSGTPPTTNGPGGTVRGFYGGGGI